MSRRILDFFMITLIFVAACGDPAVEPGDPVDVAKLAVEKSLAFDIDGLSELSCKEMRVQIDEQRPDFEETMTILKQMGVDLTQVRYDMSEVSFDLVDKGEFTATVHMGGVLRVKVPGMAEESQDQNQDIEMLLDEGRWKVCSEIQP